MLAQPIMSVAKIRSDLLSWYDAHRRDMPWRAAPGEQADPYRVWLSEIMLQQTTAAHAAPYFTAFVRRWPTIEALGRAEPGEVMAAWAGLGYYARARNLLIAAKIVAERGRFPVSQAELRELPGVGEYTAAAIGAIVHGESANVVDANVQRVVARLYAVEKELPGAGPELKRLAGGMVRAERPGDWAQALMDLGALICLPRAPVCGMCPLANACRARGTGRPERYPRRSARLARPHRHGVAYVLRNSGEVGMVLRPASGMLGGMLGLPTSEWRSAPWTEREALKAAPLPCAWTVAGEVNHVFTHFSLTLAVLAAHAPRLNPSLSWMTPSAARAATPSVFRKALLLAA
ncbi:MAG TPA: A/G-specific adenine glycosylase [Caulobacteraceae bacterium]